MKARKNIKIPPGMVDVGDKAVTHRTARAEAIVQLPREVLAQASGDDIQSRKGSVFHTAILAGIMAAKKNHELIPLCHPIGIENCQVAIRFNARKEVVVDCRVETHDRTGVEMEALTGATVAALTVYDMCKGLSHGIVIKSIRLLEKSGGRHHYTGR